MLGFGILFWSETGSIPLPPLTGTFTTVATHPRPSGSNGFFTDGTLAFSIGAETTSSTKYDECYKFDLTSYVFTAISVYPFATSAGIHGENTTHGFTIGGNIASTRSAAVNKLDFSLLTWSACTAAPTIIAYAAHGVVGNKLYYIGGYSTIAGDPAVRSYNMDTDSYLLHTPMTTGRWMVDGIAIGTDIYYGGGVSGAGLWVKYDTLLDTHTPLTSIPVSVRAFGLYTTPDKIYLVCGYDTTYRDYVYEYTISTDSWSLINTSPYVRYLPWWGSVGDTNIIANGADSPSTFIPYTQLIT